MDPMNPMGTKNCRCFYCLLSLGGKMVANDAMEAIFVILAAPLACDVSGSSSIGRRVDELRHELFRQAVKSCEQSVAAGDPVGGTEFAFRLLTLANAKAGELLKEVGSPMERELSARREAARKKNAAAQGYSLN